MCIISSLLTCLHYADFCKPHIITLVIVERIQEGPTHGPYVRDNVMENFLGHWDQRLPTHFSVSVPEHVTVAPSRLLSTGTQPPPSRGQEAAHGHLRVLQVCRNRDFIRNLSPSTQEKRRQNFGIYFEPWPSLYQFRRPE